MPDDMNPDTGLPVGYVAVVRGEREVRRVGTNGNALYPSWTAYEGLCSTAIQTLEAQRRIYGDCYVTKDGFPVPPGEVVVESALNGLRRRLLAG